VFPALGLESRSFNGLVLASLLGFPLVVALAWTFDVTKEGIRRTGPVGQPSHGMAPDRWVKLKAALVGGAFVAVVWVGVRLWQPAGTGLRDPVPVDAPMLAVLPFSDFSPGGDQAYFADGLHEELLHQLAQIPGIRLTSRTSLSHFKGSSSTAGAIADSLGARYVLEGSVRTAADSVQITVQLIDAAADEHLWSESYPRLLTLDGLFDLQRTLAMRVAGSLGGTLTEGRSRTLGTAPTKSLEAYNAYLRGLHQWYQSDIDSWWSAVDELERALALDPEFGRAHAQLALLFAALNNYGGRTQGELFPRIEEHAAAAIRLAPNDPESHMAQMAVDWPIAWDWQKSREDIEATLELDPDYIDAIWALAEWHGVIAGNTDRGLEVLRGVDVLDPFSAQVRIMRIWILMNGRRFDNAAEEGRRLLELEPTNMSAALMRISSLALAGRTQEARQELAPVLQAMPSPLPVTMAVHLARTGDERRAREVLANAVALKESGGSVPASGIAAGYAALGEVDRALDWLERSFDDEGGIYYLRSPDWDGLAGTSRFRALWDRVGLPGERPALH
jgi:TolB-like protein